MNAVPSLMNVSSLQDYKVSKAFELKVDALSGAMWNALNKRISVIVTDVAGAIVYVNEKFTEISGYQPHEMIGQNQRVLNSGTHPKAFFQAMWREITQGKTWTGDVCNTNKDGHNYWVSSQIFPLHDKHGDITNFIALQADITDQKETNLRNSEEAERLNAAIEGTGAGLWDWDLAHDRKVINTRWAEILGYKVDEVHNLGSDAFRILTHPDDYLAMRGKLEAHLRGETERYSFEFRMRHKDGTWRWIHDRGKVLQRDANGQATRMCGTHTDITERKSAQELAEKHTGLINAIVQGIPEGIASFSPDGQLLASNPPYQKINNNKRISSKLRNVIQEKIGQIYEPDFQQLHGKIKRNKKFISDGSGQYFEISCHPLKDGGIVQIVQDISDYQRSVQEIKRQKKMTDANIQYLNVTINNIPYGISVFDDKNNIKVWNDRYIDIFGMIKGEVRRGKSLHAILNSQISQGNFSGNSKEYIQNIKKNIADSGEYVAHANVNGRNIRSVHVPMPDGGWVGIHQDITEFDNLLAKASYDAEHDQLTSLLNRVGFSKHLEKAIAHCKNTGKYLHLLFIDLDGFKAINDTMGHAMGDAVLKKVASRLKEHTRTRDTVGRLGGDEFAIFSIEDNSTQSDINAFAARIVDLVSRPYLIKGRQIKIGASIGISEFPNHALSASDLILSADMAMYCVKRGPKGGFSFYDQKIRDEIIRRRKIEYALTEMDKSQELSVHYQPIVKASDFSMVGEEALARWHNQELGRVSPAEFIPIAEHIGAINDIGSWIAASAIGRLAECGSGHYTAINVSTVQLRELDFAQRLIKICDNHHVDHSRIEIEVTETVMIGENNHVMQNLDLLKRSGFKIALDDFGTGYSSLSYLNNFHFDKIKIDHGFVRNMLLNDSSMAIVKAIVGMAKALGIAVTAEGVETQEAAYRLREIGADFLQGFYFG